MSDAPPEDLPDVPALLSAAVAAIGGAERPGQVKMAEAVEQAVGADEHLAVQAGTGTGKSLAYLVPALRHALGAGDPVVVSTATIALQRQLIDRDLPRLAAALEPHLDRAPEFAILKGRRNYLCLNRLDLGAPDDPEEQLFDPRQVSALGRQVQRLHEWAEKTTTGDRDDVVPGVSDQAWRQVSVSATECLGAQRCPYGTDCYAELARDRAGDADIVVTNHSLLAIDALGDYSVLPEHDLVVVDEAHELVDRVTSAATDEISPAAIETAARRCGRLIDEDLADRLKAAGEELAVMLEERPAGRMDVLPADLANVLAVTRDAAHACVTALGTAKKDDPDEAGLRKAAVASAEDVHDTCVRILAAFESEIGARWDVVWLEQGSDRRPPTLYAAPINVSGLLRESLFGRRTVVLTSATLALGGSFEPLARQWGLPPAGAADRERPDEGDAPAGAAAERSDSGAAEHSLAWSGLDVGSPFDHPRSGILYLARHLPPPGRDGLPEAYLTELEELIAAAGGRTLGLFSSMRAARQAAEALRERVEQPLLCQGDDSTALLVKEFAEEEATCLFGTLSLWQGVDVPGPALQLVVIDRIPFPRPDDPVSSARQRSVEAHGGNGFMAVAATQAALLLAQGAGRLLRTMTDRGVVAVLDPRLAKARYGNFLQASLPPFWTTSNPQVVREALRRINS